MRPAEKFLFAAAAAVVFCGAVSAQNAISAKAGMINVADGDVFLLDAKSGSPTKVEPKLTEFIDMKEGQTLKTTEGRSEVLLTPGAFLRVWDDSAFKLYSSRLSDVRLEVLKGSAVLEVVEMFEGNEITVLLKDATVVITKGGAYRFDADPARVRVQIGEALAEFNGQKVLLKGGRQLTAASGGWTADKFDTKDSDSLLRWSKRRASYLAMANVSSSRQASPRNGFQGGSWMWNPYFGFATYIPYSDTLRSPFGYYYYTPSTVMAAYYPPSGGGGWNRGGGGNASSGFASSMPSRSAGYSSYSGPSAVSSAGAVASSPSVSAGPSNSGAVGGGGVSAGAASAGRGGSAGGRGN